jgi:hypothetical protein
MAEEPMITGGEGSAVRSALPARQRSPISGKRVLVTGATGFLGSNLCRGLEFAGASVYAVTRRPATDSAGALTWIQADCSNLQELRSTLRQVQKSVPNVRSWRLLSRSRHEQRIRPLHLMQRPNGAAARTRECFIACSVHQCPWCGRT